MSVLTNCPYTDLLSLPLVVPSETGVETWVVDEDEGT